jgi:hypothetical protein
MKTLWSVLRIALSATVWRSTPTIPQIGMPTLLACCAVLLGVTLAHQIWTAGLPLSFNLYGINAWIAWPAAFLAVAACFVPAQHRMTALATLMLLWALWPLVLEALGALVAKLPTVTPATWQSSLLVASGTLGASVIWIAGATYAVFRSAVMPATRRRLLMRATGLCLMLTLVDLAFPGDPVFRGLKFERRTANFWELGSSLLGPNFVEDSNQREARTVDRAAVEIAQPTLMDVMVQHLAPQRRGVVDVYAIGMAGWSDQDVFVKELDGAIESLGKVLPIEARTLKLINHPSYVYSNPMASRQNFAAAVRAVGKIMDKDEDVLLLFVTSHGAPEGVALHLNGAFSVPLSPEDMADVLTQEGIQSRVIIVSACYSGVFVSPLADDDAIVMTAADRDKTSFGCSNDRDWTYFGDALFNQALKPGTDFRRAFEEARGLITNWETRDRVPASNPQGHFGPAIMEKLAPLYAPGARPSKEDAAASSKTSGG